MCASVRLPRPVASLRVIALTAVAALAATLLPVSGPLAVGEARAAGPTVPRATAIRTLSHEVYAYLPYWQVDRGTVERIRYDLVSTIAFFAVPIRADGTLDTSQPGYRAYVGDAAASITDAAHRNGVRVVPTFQLFDSGRLRAMRAFLASRTAQTRFIRAAVALIVARRADGASLDFEPMPASLTAAYLRFVDRFRTSLKGRVPGAVLANATAAGASARLIGGLARRVDRQFVMAYDYRWRRSTVAGAVAPLGGSGRTVAADLARFLRYAPAGRLILGVPYYGYSWPVTSRAANAPVQRDKGRFGPVRGVSYAGARDYLRRHPGIRRLYDPATGSAYFTYWDAPRKTWRQVWFDDERSLAAKYDTAKRLRLAGIGIWALGNDGGYPELWSVLRSRFYAPVHRLAAVAGADTVTRTPGGRVRATVRWTVRNTGTVPERGTLTWAVRDKRGRVVTRGTAPIGVDPGAVATGSARATLGRARLLAAGRYTVAVSVHVGRADYHSPHVAFRQPF